MNTKKILAVIAAGGAGYTLAKTIYSQFNRNNSVISGCDWKKDMLGILSGVVASGSVMILFNE